MASILEPRVTILVVVGLWDKSRKFQPLETKTSKFEITGLLDLDYPVIKSDYPVIFSINYRIIGLYYRINQSYVVFSLRYQKCVF